MRIVSGRQNGVSALTLAVVALALATAGAARAEPIAPGAIEVVDGDTVRARGETWRLIGFDTPEHGRLARCSAERALAAAAVRRLRQLIAGGGLELERVACSCRPGTEGTRRCNHGRLCGTLRARGRDVGDVLIAEGLARPYICAGTRCPRRGDWCGDAQ